MTFDNFIVEGLVTAMYVNDCSLPFAYTGGCEGYYYSFDSGETLENDIDSDYALAFHDSYDYFPTVISPMGYVIIYYNLKYYRIEFFEDSPDTSYFTIVELSIGATSTTTNCDLTSTNSKLDDLLLKFSSVFGGEPYGINLYFQDNFNSLSTKMDNINVDLTPITTQITDLTSKLNSISDKTNTIDTNVSYIKSKFDIYLSDYSSTLDALSVISNNIVSIKSQSQTNYNKIVEQSDLIKSQISLISFTPITDQLTIISDNVTTYKESIEDKISNIDLTPITDNLNTLFQNIDSYYLDLKSLIAPAEITIRSLNGNFGTYPDNSIVNTTTYGNDWLVLGSFMTDFNNQAMPMYKLSKNGVVRFTPSYFIE